MNHSVFPPFNPNPSRPLNVPRVIIHDPVRWEYKRIVRDVESEKPLDEAELNALGTEGWEMTGTAQ